METDGTPSVKALCLQMGPGPADIRGILVQPLDDMTIAG